MNRKQNDKQENTDPVKVLKVLKTTRFNQRLIVVVEHAFRGFPSTLREIPLEERSHQKSPANRQYMHSNLRSIVQKRPVTVAIMFSV